MKIEFTQQAEKEITKLDKKVQLKIKEWKIDIESLENPRSRGKGLSGNLSGLWRYRIGDYRIICRIIDNEMIVLCLHIGHRSHIYKKY